MSVIPNLLNRIFGGGLDSILDKILPDKSEKLKIQFELRELLTRELDLHFRDMQDARDLQKVALNQTDNFSKRFTYFLSLGVLLNAIIAGLLAFFVDFPDANKELVMMYYSFSFIMGGSQVMSFHYGTRNAQQNNNVNISKE